MKLVILRLALSSSWGNVLSEANIPEEATK
jgi:hypothetical protein